MEDNVKCPICGKEKFVKKMTTLYGMTSCKLHVSGLAYLRALAFLIDIVFLSFLSVIVAEIVVGIQTQIFTQKYGFVLTACFFLLRDSFWGRSPGKFICGLVVIDANTKHTITPLASFKRNLPLLIPFLPLAVAFQLRGTRYGDGWSDSRVIRRKHKKEFSAVDGKLSA